MPKFAQKNGYHNDPRCTNEVSFRFYGTDEYAAEVFPKSSGKNYIRAITGPGSFRDDWRVGRNGLIKFVKDEIRETQSIPIAEKLFFAWLKDLGWKPRLSTPGLLAKQIYKNLEGNVAVLKNEKLLGLLEHMNGGTVKQDGGPAKINQIKQERDLGVGEVKTRLEGTPQDGGLYKYLTEREIFKLGARIQCPSCLRNSWYRLEDIKDSLSCPRCLITYKAVGTLDSAIWSYKTTGPYSVPNYADGAYTVLLTLEFFDEYEISTFRITPTLCFVAESSNKNNIEADLGAFWQESELGESKEGILFCECKTYNLFEKKDFERISYLAETFTGSILVFSTLRKSLTAQEITEIGRIAKKGRKYWKSERPINPVLILTGNELLHYLSPPYCWDKEIKQRFNNVNGLIDLCDVTQQLYLNLPSWKQEWHEKWEKKRSRNLTKIRAS